MKSNILFIGNSYTYYNDMPHIFGDLAAENGKDVKVFSVTNGGRKLIDNIRNDDEYTAKLSELIGTMHFDICFLQEQSILPITDFKLFVCGLKELKAKLDSVADRFVLYQTWGRKSDSPTLSELSLTQKEMTFALSKAYLDVAEAIGAKVSRVGEGFYDVYCTHPELELYDEDMSHPSYKGSCLAALVHYVSVFEEIPVSLECLSVSDKEKDIFKNAALRLHAKER